MPQDTQGQSGSGIAKAIREFGIYMITIVATYAAACLNIIPQVFDITDVFERKFQKRVHLLKNIRHDGKIEEKQVM